MKAILVGILAGYFSGQLGVGGGLITTPAIRLILGYPAYIAVGTPLLVNIPTSFSGFLVYYRQNFVKGKIALPLAIFGFFGSLVGSAATKLISGSIILLITAAITLSLSWQFFLPKDRRQALIKRQENLLLLGLSGFLIGTFSGFLGLGGGFLLVPFLSLYLGMDMKSAFGTSLAVISVINLPGTLVHYFLGHINVTVGGLLILGVIPGAWLGAKVALGLSDRTLRLLFGLLITTLSIYLGIFELKHLV